MSGLEEFIAAVVSDPERVNPRNPVRINRGKLDELQTILAGVGLEISSIAKEELAPIELPASLAAIPGLAGHAQRLPPLSQPMSPAQALASRQPIMPGQGPRRFTEVERGVVNNLARYAEDMRNNPGYTVKAAVLTDLIKITRSVAGETSR